VRELVIVIADLYLEPEPAARTAAAPISGHGPDAGAAPGIQHLARFGDETTLPEGWRAWVARWLGLPQHACEPPASIAAAALADAPAAPADVPAARSGAPAARSDARAAFTGERADRAVWIATPMHLIAGLTSVHLDRRSVLRLSGAELAELTASFRDTFRGSGFDLDPLESGELLLSGPPQPASSTATEPARMLLTSIAEALPAGQGAPALRRLSSEIEMWLHDHPVNDARVRRGAAPVATLWLWGGGAPPAQRTAGARETAAAAFGSDAYVRGLWRLAGGESRPMPVDWAAMIGEPGAQRALGVVEVAELLHANTSWPLARALAEVDRRLISPALAALRRGELQRLVLLANDRSHIVRAADRWRLWRRLRTVRGALEALA